LEVCVTARSISRAVLEQLQSEPPPASPAALQVLAVFEHACDLVTCNDQTPRSVIALVTPEIGDGPLNVVLNQRGWDAAIIVPGTSAWAQGERLRVCGLAIDLSAGDVWEPRPDWPALRDRLPAIEAGLPALRVLGREHAHTGSLLAVLDEGSCEDPLPLAVLADARSGCQALEAGWRGDRTTLGEGAAQLAGLGSGLTPGGDDFLCGAMMWAWLAHPRPAVICGAIAETAAPRTTTLSAALLRAAARGECSAAWHALLNALARRDGIGLTRASRGVLRHGATSGADTLAGFLWAGTRIGFG
jgi:hypothetical protein